MVLYDFHTHTFHSDGVLSPVELIRRAYVKGYSAIAITDHVALGSLDRIISEVKRDCALARDHWNIFAIPGVELTHLPSQAISDAAQKAKELGAWLVVVHGETPLEPVAEGTNLAAVQSPYVDILAHPGLITSEEIAAAAENGIFIELSARRGHSSSNAHIVSVSQRSGLRLLVNSDAHNEDDLLSFELAQTILGQAGLDDQQYDQVLKHNPLLLIDKIKKSISYPINSDTISACGNSK